MKLSRRSGAKASFGQLLQPPFDVLRFSLIPRLNYWMDGSPGHRTLFLTDEEEIITVSLEEGMRCLDLLDTQREHCCEFRQGSRYLHQARSEVSRSGTRNCMFFHMEIADSKGNIHCLPGQIIVSREYPWADGVEPILIEILNSITICN